MTTECKCNKCVKACHNKPGWFIPDEAALAAELTGATLDEFFNLCLGVDYWEDSQRVYVLTPATCSMEPGGIYPINPCGKCVLLDKNNRCMIYDARPHECREYIHTETHTDVMVRKQAVRDAWRKHQERIYVLLGQERTCNLNYRR